MVIGERSRSVPATRARLVLVTAATVAIVSTVRNRSGCRRPSDSEIAATTHTPEMDDEVSAARKAATQTDGPTVVKCGCSSWKHRIAITEANAPTEMLKASL